ncbi:SDR family NAD(P)-dependent oxidoreductase [Mariniflexile jejuense]|uniref:SDR family NAD(P)-dependent oxidoreductase n=1 Tax=Mariniflexile jejuense TaxID=1173582 RepID=A0ABW3JEZ0_9FLAO
MNQTTYNHLKELIEDSGLTRSKTTHLKPIQIIDFSNETILITGAAGSIGSELAKQLLACKYKKLILIDIAESPLYNVIKAFENENLTNVSFLLINIKEEDELKHLFETHKPTIVFHAAAYKHVPLMEVHPYEAVKTNIIATKSLADLAIKHEVKKFIFISTDKAVNPISVMGMSKRIAENQLLQLAKTSNTLFSIARFGNIIGSNGSVLPIFIKQIESGLPLTLTSPTVTRYFIGKHKACSLILQLATFNKMESHVFTFNMGKPIKLKDLADCLIDFYPNETVEIKITGLRLGEKNEESMIANDEFLVPTRNDAIFLVKEKLENKYNNLDLTNLINITPYISPQEIKNTLLTYI